MSLTKQYKTDPTKSTGGVAITFPANADGTIPTFYISRMHENNPEYAARLAAVTKPYKRQIDSGTLPDEKAKELTKEVFVSVNVKGWDNIPTCDVTGNSEDSGYTPHSKDAARKLFDNLPDLYTELVKDAQNMALFLQEELEAEAKN